MLNKQQSLDIAISLLSKEKQTSDFGHSALKEASDVLKNIREQDVAQQELEEAVINSTTHLLFPVGKDDPTMVKSSQLLNTPPTGHPPV